TGDNPQGGPDDISSERSRLLAALRQEPWRDGSTRFRCTSQYLLLPTITKFSAEISYEYLSQENLHGIRFDALYRVQPRQFQRNPADRSAQRGAIVRNRSGGTSIAFQDQ